MIYALMRYLFFEIPSAFLRGLAFIFFDKEEIIGTAFYLQAETETDRYKKNYRKLSWKMSEAGARSRDKGQKWEKMIG